MPTSSPSSDKPACVTCKDTGSVSVTVGSDQEMDACPDCLHKTALNRVQKTEVDEYNSPDGRTPVDHYIRGGIECIDAMKAISTPVEFQAFCRLTAFKYLWRLGEKDNPAHEAKKANDYTRWLSQSLAERK